MNVLEQHGDILVCVHKLIRPHVFGSHMSVFDIHQQDPGQRGSYELCTFTREIPGQKPSATTVLHTLEVMEGCRPVMASPMPLYHPLSPIPNTLYRCIRLYQESMCMVRLVGKISYF